MELITDTFVMVATDCPVTTGVVPTPRGESPTIAVIQYTLLTSRPYALTLEDLMFETHIHRANMPASEARKRSVAIRAKLFAKPYPCMRASPLPKKYGWGVHHDGAGRIAVYGVESKEYQRFASGVVSGVEVVAAMRSKRDGWK